MTADAWRCATALLMTGYIATPMPDRIISAANPSFNLPVVSIGVPFCSWGEISVAICRGRCLHRPASRPCQRQTPPGRGRWREAPEGERWPSIARRRDSASLVKGRWPPSAAGGIFPRHIPFALYYTPITTIGEEPIPALPLWVYPSNYLLVFASCGFKRGRSSFSC